MGHPSDTPKPFATHEDVVVLIAGSDPDGDALCTALAARGADVQQLSAALAVEAIVSSVPDVVLLVGDAARQRGALIRSQLVRRMRGTDVNLVVLIDGTATLSPNNALRLVSRASGTEAIAEQLMSVAHTAAASRTQGTLDQVAGMITEALERPSQPPLPTRPPAPSRIVMKAARTPVPQARQTLRVPGAIPAAAASPVAPLTAPPPTATASSAPARQLSLAPPTSLQALAARRIEITRISAPPPLPDATEVSLADMRIETDRISGEVTIERSAATLPRIANTNTSLTPATPDDNAPNIWSERPTPTPTAWSKEDLQLLPVAGVSRKASHTRWAAVVAVAACLGLIAWSTGDSGEAVVAASDETPRVDAPLAQSNTTSVTAVASADDEREKQRPQGSSPALTADDAEQEIAVSAIEVDEAGDDADPVGDEPHLVRAKQLCNEGHALRIRGRLGLAEAKYLQALGLFPQYPRAVAGVVRVHLTRGDGAEAVRWAERLAAMQPNRSNNQLLLGDAYALSGKGHDARRHWRKSAAFGNMIARKRLKNDEPALAKPTR